MPKLPYCEIHSFAIPGTPFTGNPAGVCLLESFPDNDVLRGIANSNNLSETAFIAPKAKDVWDLRWFTPAIEVDLCGHATFAAGAFLFERGLVAGEVANFDSRSGRLDVRRDKAGYAMDLPAVGYRPAEANGALETALGLDGPPVRVFNVERIHGAGYQMWVVSDEAAVRGARPSHSALLSLNTNIILTAPGDTVDFVSRFFAPASGVDEDPVTGSAHCTLAPYWAERLGKDRLTARQIGPRPGELEVRPVADRVSLYGAAPIYLDGQLHI